MKYLVVLLMMMLFCSARAQNMQNVDLKSTPHFGGYLQIRATRARKKIMWYPSVNGYRLCGTMEPLKPIPAGSRLLDVPCHCIDDYDNGRVQAGSDVGPIQFDENMAVVKTSSYPRLKYYAAMLFDNEKAYITLSGHTSAKEGIGTVAHELRLATNRAKAVKTYLVNLGVEANRIKILAYGESRPAADNSTEDGKRLNRRVEITLEK
jgi:outer membrane protein OmpA-like peptidoglycan-associated protein